MAYGATTMPGTPSFTPTGRLTGPYRYFHCSSVLDTGGSSSALTHLVAGSSSGGTTSSTANASVSGWLHNVVIGTPGSGPGIITIWDGQGSSTNPITVVGSSGAGTLTFDSLFVNWLTVAVQSSTVAADITVNWAAFPG